VTARDRYVIAVVAVVGLLGAFWFMALSPKRQELTQLDKDIAAAQQSLQTAEQEKAQFAQAQVEFPTLYASVGRLGKAVPADEDVPSLLVQLNHAAGKSGVDFRSIELKLDKNQSEAAAAPAAASASAGAAAGEGAAGSEGSAAGSESASASASAASAAPATGAAPAPAEPGAAAGAPAAAASASATLQPLPFEYKFKGNFFKLEKVLAAIADLVEARNREVAISGRLISVDGFTLKSGKVTILATSYLLPAGQSLLGGATSSGPAGVDPNAPQAASAGSSTPAPPAATVTTP
jgi:hypothetical protein